MQPADSSRFELNLGQTSASRPHLNFAFNLTFLLRSLRTSLNILIIFILEAVELTADVFPIFRFCPKHNRSSKWSFPICLFRRKAANANEIKYLVS